MLSVSSFVNAWFMPIPELGSGWPSKNRKIMNQRGVPKKIPWDGLLLEGEVNSGQAKALDRYPSNLSFFICKMMRLV